MVLGYPLYGDPELLGWLPATEGPRGGDSDATGQFPVMAAINQSTNQLINLSVNQLFIPVSQADNELIKFTNKHSTIQPWTNQPTNQSST